MATLEQLREQLDLQQQLVAMTDEVLSVIPDDPESLKERATAMNEIKDLNTRIAAAAAASTTTTTPPPPPPPQASSRAEEPQPNSVVGDSILARWSDRHFYPATVIGVTGSAVEPLYTVRFARYNTTAIVRKHEVRVTEASRKRKAEALETGDTMKAPPSRPQAPKPTPAAPAIEKAPVKKEPSLVSDGPTRQKMAPKSIKNNKQAEKQKASWQAWQQKGAKLFADAGLPKQKDSQFRVGDNPKARVGFHSAGKTTDVSKVSHAVQKHEVSAKGGSPKTKYHYDEYSDR